jgi:hypothetical protein
MKAIVCAGACALAAACGSAGAQVRWQVPHVSPASHELECARSGQIVDRQTRREIEERMGVPKAGKKDEKSLVGVMNEVARRIAAMQSAGYEQAGSGQGAVYTLRLPMRITYTRPIEFRAKVDDDAVTLGVVRRESHYEVRVDREALKYMKRENAAQVDAQTAAFVRQMDAQAQRIRDNLHERRFLWDGKERGQLQRGGQGSFVRIASYGFCGQAYRVAATSAWSAQARPAKKH